MDEDADDQEAQVPMTPEEELLDYQRRIKNMENEKKIMVKIVELVEEKNTLVDQLESLRVM